MTPLEQIEEKIYLLDRKLEEKIPDFPTVLRDIHSMLKKDEELVTLLSEEEIAVIVKGLSSQTRTVITESAKKNAGRKSLSKVTVADL